MDDLLQEESVSFKIPYSGEIKALSFSPTGQWLSALKDDNSVVIWDVTTQQQVAEKINLVRIESVSFSSNNKLLLMAPEEQSIYMWDPFGGAGDVTIVSDATKFAQYDNHVFTSVSNEVRILDASSGIEVSRFLHNEPVLDFVVNQEYVITSTEAGSAYVWVWSQTNLITEACSRLTRNLNPREWATYFSNELYRQTCPNLIE